MLLFVADKVRQGLFEYVPTSRIAESVDIPAPTLVKLVGALHGAGIIDTREGRAGGVRLAMAPEEVSLALIFEAVEQSRPLFRSDLRFHVQGTKPKKAHAAIVSALDRAEMAMRSALRETSLADLLAEI